MVAATLELSPESPQLSLSSLALDGSCLANIDIYLFYQMNTGVPAGYSAQFDALQNRYFFINNSTGKSSWELPGPTPPVKKEESDKNPPAYSDSKPLPQNFITQFDDVSGKYFFVNVKTGVSQWNDPRVLYAPPAISQPQGCGRF